MNNEALIAVIEKEKAKLRTLEVKKATIEDKIKKCRGSIQKYELMQNNAMFTSFTSLLDNKGVSFEDILSALQCGDLLGLQEKIDSAISYE